MPAKAGIQEPYRQLQAALEVSADLLWRLDGESSQ